MSYQKYAVLKDSVRGLDLRGGSSGAAVVG